MTSTEICDTLTQTDEKWKVDHINPYEELKKKAATGWNSWNTRSVLSHVLLPEGFAINLGLKDDKNGCYLKEALIGRRGENEERIRPGAHAYDGSYTELGMVWGDIELGIQSATEENDLVVLATPISNQQSPPTLVFELGILWNGQGCLKLEGDCITAELPNREIRVYVTRETVPDPNLAIRPPYLAVLFDREVGISTGKKRDINEIKALIRRKKAHHGKRKEQYGDLSDAYDAMQSCLAWDTLYEPRKMRVVSPVSRIWSVAASGYVLFCWDTYFAAYMAAIDNRELAYLNAVEITREKTQAGFIPNFASATGFVSLDRSQPPIGSMVVRELYRRYRDKWLLEELFDSLYGWNTWFTENRQIEDGLLAWGSNPYEPRLGNLWETEGVGKTLGAALESGLDNSPMYDGIPFNREKNCMELADVGLMGLYIMDCKMLADIARMLGRGTEALELKTRAVKFSKGLQSLWNEDKGIFLNRRTDSGEFSYHISPTHFYALLDDGITQRQTERMIREHFYNPDEFWGEWIIPSISRNDPAYPDQSYWRGRIWAPMNFLVYLGLRKHQLTRACRDMAEKSKKLLLKEWLENGHVHENYCGNTGEGCNKPNSDMFYHWGGLLSLIGLMEEGYIEGPEKELAK